MGRTTTYFAAALLACCGSHAQSGPVKVLEANLRSVGWQPPEPLRPHEFALARVQSIAVDHQGRVLVGFTIRERAGLVTREQPALSYRIVRLTKDGRSDLSLILPTNGWRTNSLYLNDKDQIIARANDKLQFLASDPAGQDTQANWSTLALCTLRCDVKASVSRRTLLLGAWDIEPTLTVIDISRLTVVKQCRGAEMESIHKPRFITDNFAYRSGARPRQMFDDFTERWPFCEYASRVQLPFPATSLAFAVLNDDTILLAVSKVVHNRLEGLYSEVVSSDGRVRAHLPKLPKHDTGSGYPVRGSENGERFASNVVTVHGRVSALDISGHVAAQRIAVYSSDTGEQVASIPVKIRHPYVFDFSLSPDGHRLAILEDGTVKLFDID